MFFLFFGLSHLVLAIKKAGKRFFDFFFLFFSQFSSSGRVWTEFGTKCFFSFSAYLILFWLQKRLERGFLIFFFYFFHNFLARVEYEWNSGLNFFYFSAYLIPFGLKIMPEGGFLISWIFLLFFSQFSFPSGVWTEFGTKIFLYLSLPLSTCFR